jgi:NADH-quinone oxidoreductase subunit D
VPIKTEPLVVNIGPQHPSTHGVFRMRVTLDGERITDAEMIIGYLHRSIEKLAEERTWIQNIPFTDRMDYLAAMTGNLSYCLAVERLAGIAVPERAQCLRIIFAELQRIASHAMANGTFVNDCGAWQTPLMYMFREREKVLDLFEMTCGARLTINYMRIGGVAFDIPDEFMPRLRALVDELPDRIDEYERLLTDNEILIMRARDVGVVPPDLAINAALSGPMLRGSGIAWDIRKADPYCGYEQYDFEIPVGHNGDCYDRFMQAMERLPAGPHLAEVPLNLRPPPGEIYSRIESPKGELGFYLVSDGGPTPYRFHVRSPSLINLSALREMVIGQTVADAIVTLGSIDINVGEVDR